MQLVRWIALPVSAAIATGLLASCGDQPPDDNQPAPATPVRSVPDGVVAVPGDVERIRDDIDEFYWAWYGSLEDRQAAEVVLAHELNGKFDECVEQAGYDQDWRSTINTAVEWPSLQNTRWLRAPMQHPESNLQLKAGGVSGDGDREPADPKQNDAIEQCRNENPPLSRPAELLFPAPVKALDVQWKKQTEEAVWPVTGDEDDYVACVSKTAEVIPGESLKGTSYYDMVGSYLDQLRTLQPVLTAIPVGDRAPSIQWSAYVAAETRFEQASWTCAEPVYARGMRVLPAVVDTFRMDHADEIEKLRQHWVNMREAASKLGWSPSRPYAGR